MGLINLLLSNLEALEVGLKSCNYTEGAAPFYSFNSQQCLRHFSAAGENKYVPKCHYSVWNSRLCWLFGVYYCHSVAKNLVISLNKNLEQPGIAKKGKKWPTAIRDVKSSSRHGVISLELQPQCVGVGRQMGGTLSSSEPPNYEGIISLPIFHR